MVEAMWESGRIGPNPPTSASWGNCKIDYPRDRIVSPYSYKTAKEHYQALMTQAKAHGGPSAYTKATTPDWDGFYIRDPNGTDTPGFTGPDRRPGGPLRGERWQWGGIEQTPTLLSLLGVAVPSVMEGRILSEAFANGPNAARLPVRRDTHTVRTPDGSYSVTAMLSTVTTPAGSYRYFDSAKAQRKN